MKSCLAILLLLLFAFAGLAAENKSNYPALFRKAAAEFDVPADVLMGVAFAETRWSHLQWAPGDTQSCMGMPRPYGIMSLWDNDHFGRTLSRAAQLLGEAPETLKADVFQNMRGGAALLRKLYLELPIPEGTAPGEIESWGNAVAAYCGIPQQELALQHSLDIYVHMKRGYHKHGIEWPGRPVKIDPLKKAVTEAKARAQTNSGSLTHSHTHTSTASAPAAVAAAELGLNATPDYPPAIWRPAYPGHWYTSGNARAFVVIHDMEGYYLSTISYFQRETTEASIHYCVNGRTDYSGDAPPGEITQMVEERYWAWHARCWNTYMFGIEHEGFVDNPAWYTDEMYQASGRLTAYLCNKYGIPKDRNHIIGHGEKANAAWRNWMAANWPQIDASCNTHTDPGANWNWTYYMNIVTGASNQAICLGISAPASVAPGQTFTATITVQNTGLGAWTSGGSTPHRLGSQSPQDNTRWGLSRVELPASTIAPSDNASFTFTATAPTNLGTYAFSWRLVEEGVEWFGETCNLNITVEHQPPVIISQPATRTNAVGTTATFSVGASGSGLGYQWQRNGVNISNGGKISGTRTPSLTITNVQLADAGFYTVMITNIGGTVASQEAQLVLAANPSPLGSGGGLRGLFYDNMDFTSLKRSRIDATVNFDWSTNSPSSTMDPDTFSVRWLGQVEPRYPQAYTFYVRSDDGARLWVNGVLLINQWVNQGTTEWSGSIALEAGQKYDLRLDYFENGGVAAAQLRWSSASQIKEIIPMRQLYRPPPALAAITNRTVAAGGSLLIAASLTNFDRYLSSQPIADFEDFANGSPNDTVMFRKPSFSGSTDQFLDLGLTNYTSVTGTFPPGNSSGRALRATWTFATGTTNPWLRLTTASAASLPNPAIDFTRALWFDIYTDKNLKVAVGARETGVSVIPGADGGSTGDIEWVGVSGVTNASPVPIHAVPAASWTTVQTLLSTEPVRAFTGNGILETTNNRGALEHLALVPSGGTGAYNIYLDNFVLVEPNSLTYSLGTNAPAGASIDPKTGILTWAIPAGQPPGTYNITIRVTDAGTPPVTTAQTFAVIVPPLRLQSITRNGQSVTLTWNGVAGSPYKVQFKTNLNGLWQDLTTVTPTQSSAVFTESASAQQRFYRITVGP